MPGRIKTPGHNLPTFLTSFVGREREIREVCDLLAAARLVTLVGPGGVGKTRLALEVAGMVNGRYGDGAWWVDLSPLSDPGLIPDKIGAVIGLRDEPGRTPRDALRAFLGRATALLVLENCEQWASACGELARNLLREATGLHVLVSNRERLGVQEERAYNVPPLSVPIGESLHVAITDLLAYESVRLFAERAAAAIPAFRLTAENGETVARICRRLDGVPLAIEFAAAWARFMSVDEIDARLARRFALPPSSIAPRRPDTLQAALDWRYELLSPKERVLLQRLSAFAGGWTMTAAEAVCAGGEIEVLEVPDMIGEFVDQSLVVREIRDGEVRCRLLDTVRGHARGRLTESGEAAAVLRAHREFFLAMVEEAEPQLAGPRQAEVAASLDVEHDNLRAAMEAYRESGDVAGGLRMAAALMRYWELRGRFAEGSRWLKTLLDTDAPVPDAVRGNALFAAAVLLYRHGDLRASEKALHESLAIHRKGKDRAAIARALSFLANIMVERGEYGTAERGWEEALALMREAGDEQGAALCLHYLGFLASLRGQVRRSAQLNAESLEILRRIGAPGSVARVLQSLATTAVNLADYGRAAALYEESLTIRRRLGDTLGMAEASWGVGRLARLQGDTARAASILEEALSLAKACGATRWLIFALAELGEVAANREDPTAANDLLAQALETARSSGHNGLAARVLVSAAELAIRLGEHQRAASQLEEAAEFFIRSGRRHGLARCLERFAWIASAQGDHARAVPLLAAASSIRDHSGAAPYPQERAFLQRAEQSAKETLGEARFAGLWADGRRLPDDLAVRLALTGEPARPEYPANLTAREVDVLRLLALGASVSKVASQLTISPHTAKRHVANIYGKLGVASRHEATLRAHELGVI